MRMAEFHWSQVRVTLFVAIAAIILFAAIFYFGLVGSPLSHNATLYGQFDDFAGLGIGSPIELSGIQVGQVVAVDLPDVKTGKVPVTLSLSPEALQRVGPSSEAFTSGHALVGQRFVGLTLRSPDEEALKNGDMIRTRSNAGFEGLTTEAAQAMKQVTVLVKQAQVITGTLARVADSVEKGNGTVGKFLSDDTLYTQLTDTLKNARSISHDLATGRGPLGTLIKDQNMADQLRESTDALAATAERLREGKGVLGKLTNDDEAAARLDHTLANLDSVSTKLADAKGMLGALIGDPAVQARFTRLLGETDELIADVRRNPQRYLKVKAF